MCDLSCRYAITTWCCAAISNCKTTNLDLAQQHMPPNTTIATKTITDGERYTQIFTASWRRLGCVQTQLISFQRGFSYSRVCESAIQSESADISKHRGQIFSFVQGSLGVLSHALIISHFLLKLTNHVPSLCLLPRWPTLDLWLYIYWQRNNYKLGMLHLLCISDIWLSSCHKEVSIIFRINQIIKDTSYRSIKEKQLFMGERYPLYIYYHGAANL